MLSVGDCAILNGHIHDAADRLPCGINMVENPLHLVLTSRVYESQTAGEQQLCIAVLSLVLDNSSLVIHYPNQMHTYRLADQASLQ